MRRISMILLAALTAVFLIGCSTTSTIKAHPNYSDSAPIISVVNKNETISVFVSGKNEDKEEIDLLRTELMNQFQQNGFIITENNPTVTVKVQIVNLKRVSRGTRMLLGALAGKARIDIKVTIIKNNHIISIFELETEAMSFTGWGNLPGTTKQAIDGSAEKVVKIITAGYTPD